MGSRSFESSQKNELFAFQLKSTVDDLTKTHSNQPPLKVICQTETPMGMMNLRGIMEECVTPDKHLQFEAFVFGSDDFLASIGKDKTEKMIKHIVVSYYIHNNLFF